MKLVFLGTSAAQPTPQRGLSCICLERKGEIFMFDAGEGSQIRYMKSGLGWNKKNEDFGYTHARRSLCRDLGIITKQCPMQNRTEKLEIFGPKGIDEFLSANIKILNFGLTFPIMITIIDEGKIIDEKEYTIHVSKADHSITAYSYRFDEKDKPGRFYKEKAQQLGIPKGQTMEQATKWRQYRNKWQDDNSITSIRRKKTWKENWDFRRYKTY